MRPWIAFSVGLLACTGEVSIGAWPDASCPRGTLSPDVDSLLADAAVAPGPDAEASDASVEASLQPLARCGFAVGGTGDQILRKVVTDARGSTLLVGSFTGRIELGSAGVRDSRGDYDAFVIKLDGACQPLWTRTFGDVAWQLGTGLAVDPSGNVFVGVVGQGTLDFGKGPHTASINHDLYVAKLTPDGDEVFSRHFGDSAVRGGNDMIEWLDVDETGAIYLTGWFSTSIAFGGPALAGADPALGTTAFLAKLNGAGDHVFSRAFGVPGSQGPRRLAWSHSVAASREGDVAITGMFTDKIRFDDQGPEFDGGSRNDGDKTMFVASFDRNTGAHRWSHAFPNAWGSSVAFASGGALVAAGDLYGTTDFGLGSLTSAGGTDAAITRFDRSGVLGWVQRFGDAADQHANHVAVSLDGKVHLAGGLSGTVTFGGDALASPSGAKRVFSAELDGSTGAVTGVAMPRGDADHVLPFIAFRPDGSAMLGARYNGRISFPAGWPAASPARGGNDAFVMTFP